MRNHGAPGTLFLADKVETEQEFSAARAMGYALFQGYFFEKPFCLFKQLPSLSETPYGKLLSALTLPVPDVNTCAAVVWKDPMLSYMFHREERALNLPSGRLVTDVRISIYRMGAPQFRRWVCLAMMKQNGKAGTDELIRRAYQRGLFMEGLAGACDLPPGEQAGNCFLTGVLSLLDKVTGDSQERLLRGVNLPQSVRDALRGRGRSAYVRLLQYAVIYEMGNERLILPDIGARLDDDGVVGLYMKCMTETDAALARMEDANA